ncbi:Transporter substrate-binding domain-containing protein [Vibrio chagasii]|nr:Transporter substrate-binding domain-containing protein [Vibrio chagasii]
MKFKIGMVALAISSCSLASDIELNISANTHPTDIYVIEQVTNALAGIGIKSHIKYSPEVYSEGRMRDMVSDGSLDLFWSMTSKQLESDYYPVRVPLYKGLMGIRLLMINDGSQSLFSNVKSLDDLSELYAGQGTFWPDTEILRANSLNVRTAVDYHSMFPMLDGERFDYFPRGIHEPWGEIERYDDKYSFAVEPNLAISYTAPVYLFVSKNNAQLAKSLYKGLNTTIKDGSFDEIFYQSEFVIDTLERANINDRTVLQIKNPLLTEETPVDTEEYWLKINN